MKKEKLLKLIRDYNKYQDKVKNIKKELLGELIKINPDEKQNASLLVGKWKLTKSSRASYIWDIGKLELKLGKDLFNQVIDTKISVNKDKLDELFRLGQLNVEKLRGTFEIKYSQALLIHDTKKK